MAAPAPDYPKLFNDYVEGITSGTIPSGRLQRLAVERHLRDLSAADYYFDEEAGFRACSFFNLLKHSKGPYAGLVFVLSPWQVFITANLFGWMRRDNGLRRFRSAFIEVCRKNGKTTYASGLALYCLVADGEQGAEVYCAATKRDQAKLVFSEAVRMVKSSSSLGKRVKIYRDNLNIEATFSKMEPLSADYNSMDGLNPSVCIIDELHAHKNRFVWDLLDTATGSRSQPLLIVITTAGQDQSASSVCWEQHVDCENILEGRVSDDTIFAFIACVDKDDDWQEEASWVKANPNWGISVSPDDLKRKCNQAIRSPRKQAAFLRSHLGRWTKLESPWIDHRVWAESAGDPDPEMLKGEVCYGGLDLANRFDLNAFAKVFPREDGVFEVLTQFWMPEGVVDEKSITDGVDYRLWADMGLIELTDGDVADFTLIQKAIEDSSEIYLIEEIAYDPHNCTQLALNLEAFGLTVVQFNQNMRHYNEPSKEFERLIVEGKLHHGENAVLDWMISCCSVKEDVNGYIRPVKPSRSTGKRIDGVVAIVMALSRAMLRDNEPFWGFSSGK